jgi:hypothetical protein
MTVSDNLLEVTGQVIVSPHLQRMHRFITLPQVVYRFNIPYKGLATATTRTLYAICAYRIPIVPPLTFV